MILRVNDKSISELQNDFNALFPYLRIEFPKDGNAYDRGNSAQSWSRKKITIGELLLIHEAGKLEIREDMTVTELKKMFKIELGLIVKVYRKSDNLWLETNLTDNLTLAQQNQHGKDLS